jgi:hypothetical protein
MTTVLDTVIIDGREMVRMPFTGRLVPKRRVRAIPAPILDAAARVLDALEQAGYTVTCGTDSNAHVVVVESCTGRQRQLAESIAHKASAPDCWCGAVNVGSSLNLYVKTDRARYLELKRIERLGESAIIDGVLMQGAETPVPLRNGDAYQDGAA